MWMYKEMECNKTIEVKGFNIKSDARNYLNERVRYAKSNNKKLKTYYIENSYWYSIKDLRLADDIEAENNGLIDLGDEGTYSYYFELTEVEE